MDPPAAFTIPYLTKEEVNICKISLPKEHKMQVSILSLHYDPREWHEPMKFIPERFDSQSKYFYKPDTKEPRHTLSYAPFSFGLRKCPGQILAMLELKFLLAKFVTTVKYEVDEDLLMNEYVRFPIFTSFKLKIKYQGKY